MHTLHPFSASVHHSPAAFHAHHCISYFALFVYFDSAYPSKHGSSCHAISISGHMLSITWVDSLFYMYVHGLCFPLVISVVSWFLLTSILITLNSLLSLRLSNIAVYEFCLSILLAHISTCSPVTYLEFFMDVGSLIIS